MKICFQVSKVDLCLLVRKNRIRGVYIGVWVDDLLVVGDLEGIDMAILDWKNCFFLESYRIIEIIFEL